MKKGFLIALLTVLSFLMLACKSDLVVSDDGPYTITFNSNGGTPVEEMTVDEHDFFLPPSVPTKEGYIFAGWYIDEDLIYPMAFNAGTAASLTLYAKWVLATDNE
ncbi:MAG: InlB B-repeat-containing protein [Acholeplasmataceae bacterium]|jgi:uncharacterized repeat protein (TIGR02543 family)|nr:InlB B-repeat-containing protein [Acholeplasmataceae bacterium]